MKKNKKELHRRATPVVMHEGMSENEIETENEASWAEPEPEGDEPGPDGSTGPDE